MKYIFRYSLLNYFAVANPKLSLTEQELSEALSISKFKKSRQDLDSLIEMSKKCIEKIIIKTSQSQEVNIAELIETFFAQNCPIQVQDLSGKDLQKVYQQEKPNVLSSLIALNTFSAQKCLVQDVRWTVKAPVSSKTKNLGLHSEQRGKQVAVNLTENSLLLCNSNGVNDIMNKLSEAQAFINELLISSEERE